MFFQYVKDKKLSKWDFLSALTPFVGLTSYMAFLYFRYRDPLLFITAQSGFGNSRTTNGLVLVPQVIWRYVKIITSANHNFEYSVALVELFMFVYSVSILLFGVWKVVQKIRNSSLVSKLDQVEVGILLFSLANIILPTLTGTLSSVPRYALPSLALYFVISKYAPRRIVYLIIGLHTLLQVILLAYFQKG